MTSEDLEDPWKRKRERDKQNQREKRRREKDTFQELELRNACLEQQLKELYDGTNGNVKDLTDTVRILRAENATLREKLERVDQFVKSWAAEGDQAGPVKKPPSVNENGNGEEDASTHIPRLCNIPTSGSSVVESYIAQKLEAGDYIRSLVVPTHDVYGAVGDRASDDNYISTPFPSNENRPGMTIEEIAVKLGELVKIPAWERLPPNTEVHKCFDPFGSAIRRLKGNLVQVGMLDREPTALDLIFGGSLNELANSVFKATAQIPARRTEKLAINYVDYLMARWIVNPTEKNYAEIPNMLLPTAVQHFVPHPPMFDYVVWPQMRDNFIRSGTKYCRSEVFGLLFCTCRIRDTPNSDFVTRSGGSDPEIDPKFIKKISTIEGWVLLDKFWTEYPELVDGMDADKFMISEKDLI